MNRARRDGATQASIDVGSSLMRAQNLSHSRVPGATRHKQTCHRTESTHYNRVREFAADACIIYHWRSFPALYLPRAKQKARINKAKCGCITQYFDLDLRALLMCAPANSRT